MSGGTAGAGTAPAAGVADNGTTHLHMGPEPGKLYVNSPDLAGEFMMPDD